MDLSCTVSSMSLVSEAKVKVGDRYASAPLHASFDGKPACGVALFKAAVTERALLCFIVF